MALAYYTVSAPTAGIVGDIPVRVGDRVTKSTLLTTIDRERGPRALHQRAGAGGGEAEGRPARPPRRRSRRRPRDRAALVRLGRRSTGATQSVLAKATLEKAAGLRTEQFVRARIVWSEPPALTVPIVALNRVGGQFFAYVAEGGEGGATVARQRAVEPGPVVGNDYVVKSGLKAGRAADRVRRAEDRRRRAGDGPRRRAAEPAPKAAPAGEGRASPCPPKSSSGGRSWRRSARC